MLIRRPMRPSGWNPSNSQYKAIFISFAELSVYSPSRDIFIFDSFIGICSVLSVCQVFQSHFIAMNLCEQNKQPGLLADM